MQVLDGANGLHEACHEDLAHPFTYAFAYPFRTRLASPSRTRIRTRRTRTKGRPMTTAYAIITVITILATAGEAAASFARADFVLANSAEVHVPPAWIPRLAALKAAAAVGLLLGLVGVRPIAIAAASGLVLFFVCAITAHVRARVFHNIAFPAAYLALATASLALVATR